MDFGKLLFYKNLINLWSEPSIKFDFSNGDIIPGTVTETAKRYDDFNTLVEELCPPFTGDIIAYKTVCCKVAHRLLLLIGPHNSDWDARTSQEATLLKQYITSKYWSSTSGNWFIPSDKQNWDNQKSQPDHQLVSDGPLSNKTEQTKYNICLPGRVQGSRQSEVVSDFDSIPDIESDQSEIPSQVESETPVNGDNILQSTMISARPKQRKKPSRVEVSTSSGYMNIPVKEVVAPLTFNMNGPISLSQFFWAYERYFDAKFRGNQRDCTQALLSFLPPEMAEVYESLGGSLLKYQEMKAELTRWYKAKKGPQGSRFWRQELQKSCMRRGETICVYASRLKHTATRAYANKTECLKELIYHFRTTTPASFRARIEQAEDVREQAGMSKKLTWPDYLRLAEKEDRRRQIEEHQELSTQPNTNDSGHPICFADTFQHKADYSSKNNRVQQSKMLGMTKNYPNHSQVYVNSTNSPRGNGRHNWNRRTFTSPQQQRPFKNNHGRKLNNKNAYRYIPLREEKMNNSTRQRSWNRDTAFQSCNWCGKLGHQEDECWNKRKMQHVPKCSSCNGPHLGKDCPQNGQNDENQGAQGAMSSPTRRRRRRHRHREASTQSSQASHLNQ